MASLRTLSCVARKETRGTWTSSASYREGRTFRRGPAVEFGASSASRGAPVMASRTRALSRARRPGRGARDRGRAEPPARGVRGSPRARRVRCRDGCRTARTASTPASLEHARHAPMPRRVRRATRRPSAQSAAELSPGRATRVVRAENRAATPRPSAPPRTTRASPVSRALYTTPGSPYLAWRCGWWERHAECVRGGRGWARRWDGRGIARRRRALRRPGVDAETRAARKRLAPNRALDGFEVRADDGVC